MLIKGVNLTPTQREIVLCTFTNRWTFENSQAHFRTIEPGCIGCRQGSFDETKFPTDEAKHACHAPLVTDDTWIAQHAFRFVKDGSRLARQVRLRRARLHGGLTF